ncbi:MAG TPA: protein kinase [Holophagaceae bacterium]|jgi:hypothetical protein|nr:protein kinase [Holophagaceae bacterium]
MFTHLGKFEILRSLGSGAMGEVFLARDPAIGREVAVKTILASTTAGQGAKDRFAREAKAAGALNHPGIVTIHEFGEDQGILYLAMEFVEGDDLQDLLAARALPKADLLEILAQVSEALAYAHRKGVLHRDVKPSNIRVTREGGRLQAKLMDFGIARISESTLTSTGLLMGTVAYMAPEYVKTGTADPRGDLFAVGVMLYEGLSGTLPFAGDTTATILYRLVHETPKPLPPSALLGASPALRGVLDRALAKDPERRYPDGDTFAVSLRAAKDPGWIGDGVATTMMARPVAEPPARRGGFLKVAALLVALGGSAFVWRHRPKPVPVAAAPAPVEAQAPTPAPIPVASAPLPVQPPQSAPVMQPAVPESKPAAPVLKPEPPPQAAPVDTAQDTEPLPSDAPADPVATASSAVAAAKEIDQDPAQAHRDLLPLIQAHPENPHLRALNLVALAKSGDGSGFVSAWDAALAAGVKPGAMWLTPRFNALVRGQKQNPTLPDEALERLQQAYGGQKKPQRRWARQNN